MSTINRLMSLSLWIAVPYLVGCFLSIYVIPEHILEAWFVVPLSLSLSSSANGTGRSLSSDDTEDGPILSSKCEKHFQSLLGLNKLKNNPFTAVTLQMHRNGDTQACGEAVSPRGFLEELRIQYKALEDLEKGCPVVLNKYQVETLLTSTFQNMISTCPSAERGRNKKTGLLGFCDTGPKNTPILLDHNDLVPVTDSNGKTSLPCHFHTREGLRITELKQLIDLVQAPTTETSVHPDQCQGDSADQTCGATDPKATQERHLYAVPAGRVYMFAPNYVGEIFNLPHVEGADQKPIFLEVLSLEPRVFDVFNFFSREESQELVDKAIAETKDSHKIKRSSTGASGYSVNSRRTSESGFDTNGKTAVKVKKRCFKALGFDEYLESHGDGLQILRYNISKAYNSHMDWIEDTSGQLEHDYESGGTGGNRFATILLYMSDLGEDDGGETVFPKGWPSDLDVAERVNSKSALESLRASDRGGVLEYGSWEEDLVAKCRTRMAIRPHSSRAVLFYSQLPNGQVDPASLHGACPVLSGQKYAANLWVWNTPRQGYPGAPVKEEFRNRQKDTSASAPAAEFKQISAVFKNSGGDPVMAKAELFFEENFWGALGEGDPELSLNTYKGHEWNVKVAGKVVKTWVIQEEDGQDQKFAV